MNITLKQEEERILREALHHHGIPHQMQILQEEAAELITAISHLQRKRPNAEKECMEEIADCLICLLQMYLIYKGDIIKNFEHKLARLKGRLNLCSNNTQATS